MLRKRRHRHTVAGNSALWLVMFSSLITVRKFLNNDVQVPIETTAVGLRID